MARSGKIIAHHRHGQGKLSAHALTVIRPGPIGDAGMRPPVAEQYVDPWPQLSARGLDIDRKRDPRGNIARTRDESHIQKRTRGRHGGHIKDSRTHHRDGLVSKD